MRMLTIQKALLLSFLLYACPAMAQTEGNVENPGGAPGTSSMTNGNLSTYNLFDLSSYLIEGRLSNQNAYTFTLYQKDNKQDSKVEFTLRPLSKEAFILNFFTAFAELQTKLSSDEEAKGLFGKQFPNATSLSYNVSGAAEDASRQDDYERLKEEATRLFYMFVARGIVNDSLNDEPIAGTICYNDEVQILRRDFNDRPSNSAMKRLRKAYKTDRKWVTKNLKEGAFDQSLWFNSDSSLDPDAKLTDEVLNAFPGEASPPPGGLSGQFSFTELSEGLNRRTFFRKKGNALLRKRAAQRQAQYEAAADGLSANQSKLEAAKNTRAQYEDMASKVEELISIEQKIEPLEEALKKALAEVRNSRRNTYDSIERALEESLEKAGGLQFISTSRSNTLSFQMNALIDRSAKLFIDLLQCDCGSADCQELASSLKETIEQGKTALSKAVEKENELWAAMAARALADTTGLEETQEEAREIREKINTNNRALGEIIGRYANIPAEIDAVNTAYEKYCEIANTAIPALTSQQAELAGQMELNTYKYEAKMLLANRLEGDSGDALMSEWENLKQEVKDSVISLSARINTLEETIQTQRLDLIRAQDQLIFKQFMVDKIVIEINEGFIENILVTGTVDEYADKYGKVRFSPQGQALASTRVLKFENSSPIGFSRKLDFDVIKGIKLYTRGGSKTHYETYLEDIINIYIQEHKVGRRDYSPANQIVVLKKDEGEQSDRCLELKKEATYRLFEAKVFSDFVGLDDTEPNGLIQTEISRQINLLTSRKPFQFFTLGGLRNDWNMGFLSFVEPTVVLSKIEDNNRFLQLDTKDRFINNEYTPIKFASTLSLKQFENFSAGARANLLLFDMPNLKSTLYLNWGMGYGRTAVRDSIRSASGGTVQVDENGVEEYGVNTFTHYPEIMWSIYEDERYGLSFSWRHHWFYLRDNRFEQVANTGFFLDQETNPTKDSRRFNTIRFLTYLEPSNNNKGRLFFRYTYNWQQGFWRTGFHQAQVGYSFFLLGRQGG